MGDAGVPFAALIAPDNPNSGPYGGMSFVLFPVEDAPAMIALVVGTQGLSPDEETLGRPGHARKARAVAQWLNRQAGSDEPRAWSKPDPTLTEQNVPANVSKRLPEYSTVFQRYGRVIYAYYCPDEDTIRTEYALAAFLDLMFQERGIAPLAASRSQAEEIRNQWMESLLPSLREREIQAHLHERRFVILAGPPGTGKTRAALRILENGYAGAGFSIQFHPNTTYEGFVGGLAPERTDDGLGFAFTPRAGDLMLAAQRARENPDRPFLLHIDEINRADLAKVMGEAIFLLEAASDAPRRIRLPYAFTEIDGCEFDLPPNLHILGTMNTSDRSIAIVDVAVRRRFAFLQMWPELRVVNSHGAAVMQTAFRDLLEIFVEHATDEAFDLLPGHSYFLDDDEKRARRALKITLAPLLNEYLAQGYVAGFAAPIQAYLQWLESL